MFVCAVLTIRRAVTGLIDHAALSFAAKCEDRNDEHSGGSGAMAPRRGFRGQSPPERGAAPTIYPT